MEAAPRSVKAQGFTPSPSGALGRALVRDLALRMAYLESCERKLSRATFSPWELALLQMNSPSRIYRGLIEAKKRTLGFTQIELGVELGIHARKLRGFMAGEAPPQWAHLRFLCPRSESHRLLVAIGFLDTLLRRLRLSDVGLSQEILQMAEAFLPGYRQLLETFNGTILHRKRNGSIGRESRDFKRYVGWREHLLIHPGFEELIRAGRMPTALWRCHLFALRFATFLDLSQAYFQFSDDENDRHLEKMLRAAERTSKGRPDGWIAKLKESNPVVAFPVPANRW